MTKPCLPSALLAFPFFLTACIGTASFVRADSDKDGRVSHQEASSHDDLSVVFSSADADQDGYLNSAEYDLALELIWRFKNQNGEVADVLANGSGGAGSGGGGGGHGGHQH
tara:strand:- start:1379 stop:1711 length:333 start_codon:yes stop_codon:yes gene_type:complete